MCVRGPEAGVLNWEYADYGPLNEQHTPPTWGGQIVPSASELPLWGSENPGVILIVQFQYTHTKEAESQDLLQIPDAGVGGGGGRARARVVLHPTLEQAEERG